MAGAAEIDREALVCEHIAYAAKVARQFCRRRQQFGIEYDELRSAAMLGLVDAAQRFEPAHGVQFGAYSYPRIKGAMVDLLRRGGWNNSHYLRFRADRLAGEEPSPVTAPNELLALLHARTNGEYASAINSIEEVSLRMRARVLEDGSEEIQFTYANEIGPERYSEHESTRRYLLSRLDQLCPDERQVLRLHYFEGLSYSQMRYHFGGISKAGLSRLHRRAIENLRQLLEADRARCEQLLAVQFGVDSPERRA